MDKHEIVCYTLRNDPWKIVIPNCLVNDVLDWYHIINGHAGIDRLVLLVGARFYIPNLRQRCEEAVKQCPKRCQQYKAIGRGYGKFPEKEATFKPWDVVAADLIGPWKLKLRTRKKKKTFEFMALIALTPAQI